MIRSAPLALALAFAAGAVSAQDTYVPLAEGNVWTYEVKKITKTLGVGVEARSTLTATCRTGKTLGGLEYHRLVWSDSIGELDHDVWIRADGNGVRIAASSSRKHLLLLPGELQGGQAHVEIEAGGAKITLDRLKVGMAEEVSVPAGTYVAVPVTNTVKVVAVDIDTTVWYARGVGAVKVVERVVTGGMVEVRRELNLKSFSGVSPAAPMPADPAPPVEPTPPVAPTPGAEPTPPAAPTPPAPRANGKLSGMVDALIDQGPGGGRQDALAGVVRQAVKRSGAGIYAAVIEPLLSVPAQTIHNTGPYSPGTALDERRVYSGGLTVNGISDCVIVCRGDLVSTNTVKDSILIVTGNIRVQGYLKDSVVLCLGDVTATAYIKDDLLIATGNASAGGYVKDSVVQVGGVVSASGYSKDNVYLNGVKVSAARSKNDRHLTVAQPPLDLLR